MNPDSAARIARLVLLLGMCFAPVAALARAAASPASQSIYDDGLSGGWQNWSWDSTVALGNSSPVQSGAASIAVTYNAGWAALYLHTDTPVSTAGYDRLRFWIHGGAAGGQQLRVVANGDVTNTASVTGLAGAWTQYDVLLASLGSPASIGDLYWQDVTGGAQPVFYLDSLSFVSGGSATPTPPPGAGPALTVDVTQGRQPISPYIYGMNFADEALADELDLPVNRWGGNHTSRYNWQTDISNHASDWYFENVKQSSATNLPADSAAVRFIEQNRRTGTDTLLSLPMMGYVSNDDPLTCGFRLSLYGAQTGNDWQWRPDCGNGVWVGGVPVTGNNPLDTSWVVTQSFSAGWVGYLAGRYGPASSGGVRFYNLDNEPDLWFETHRDAFPIALTYDGIYSRTVDYATAIRAADPSAQILGPVLHGWTYYWHSPRDGQQGLWATRPDRMAHGDVPLAPWYLAQLRAHEQASGVRLIDYFDLHYYPQAPGVSLSPAGDPATQALRLRSTRSLWDPAYADESWINGTEGGPAVRLIPRMRAWVEANYPGTRLAIGEYNWGALDHLNGALAQADVLGIFGREGLGLATLWAPPTAAQPGAFAFRIYRNYDGAGSRFGDVSVRAVSADQGQLAIYAAQRAADWSLTLIVINKTDQVLTSTISLSGFSAGPFAAVYRYAGADLAAIVRLADQPAGQGGFTAAFPASSITLFNLPASGAVERLYLPLIRR